MSRSFVSSDMESMIPHMWNIMKGSAMRYILLETKAIVRIIVNHFMWWMIFIYIGTIIDSVSTYCMINNNISNSIYVDLSDLYIKFSKPRSFHFQTN